MKESFDGEILGYVDTIKNPNFIRMNYGEGGYLSAFEPDGIHEFLLVGFGEWGLLPEGSLVSSPGCERGVG